MDKILKEKISGFLSEYPLYRKFDITSFDSFDLWILHGHTFNFFCKNENSNQTFELEWTPKEVYDAIGKQPSSSNYIKSYASKESFYFTQHFIGKCSSCKEYYMDILINEFSEGGRRVNHVKVENRISHFIRKIGQEPPYEIKPEKDISSYLCQEDLDYYQKALMNLSTSYGVGAFAYLRRVVENVIKKLINDVSELDFDGANEVKVALKKYNQDHQMSSLIEELNSHLPSSLTSLGSNPIKLLYEQLSEGIHVLNDDDCLEKATSINTVLKYTIRKIREEANEVKVVKEALKKLGK